MIGLLKTRVTITEPIVSRIHGEVTSEQTTLATVWAQVLPRGSREAYRQSQVVAELNYLVRIRFRDDITADMQITWGTKTLKIIGIPSEEIIDGTRLLSIPCQEVDR